MKAVRGRLRLCALGLMAFSGLGLSGAAEEADAAPTIESLTRDSEKREGLLELFVDRSAGKVWLSLPPAAEPAGEVGRFLYVEGLTSGLGSNPIGLDRGLLGRTRLVVLRRIGGRVLLEEINLRFRALTDDWHEREAVRQSFARSALWGGEIQATDAAGRSVVDFTSFIVRDAFGVAEQLARTGQGRYEFAADRSGLDLQNTLSFPANLEFEAVLTWTNREPGTSVAGVAPTAESITLVQHQSLLRLPDDGYRPRRFDPRAGSFAVAFNDYAAPLDSSIEKAWIVRHRLQKTDPRKARSTVKEPIVYYLDRGAPEPVRSALLDGARWWNAAFDAAGFIDAFRVELLPEGAHPLDVRYNVIEWVHRSTRGWSNGGGVIDPRTGEMIKGHVRLGSLRVRQDRLLFEGLAGTAATGSGRADDPVELALARIRQLSAHEVGHTLGLAHNFAASTYGGRASVMDYPAPLVRIDGAGELDFSDAYTAEIGLWDRLAVRYAYAEFAPGEDGEQALQAIVERALEEGWLFLTDRDARPAGAAQPIANLWDNGSDPVAELVHSMRVRRIALDRFDEENIAPGTPLALLQEVLAPLYLHHRYQLNAAVKTIGGLDYRYALRGDGQPLARPIDGARQRKAIEAVLSTLDPAELELSPSITRLLLPRPPGSPSGRELFAGSTAPVFDPLAAAATAAGMTIAALLQPERAARLVNFHLADPSLPSFEQLLQALGARVMDPAASDEPIARGEIRDEIQRVLVAGLIRLGSSTETASAVRVRVDRYLSKLGDLLEDEEIGRAQREFLLSEIRRYRERPGPAVTHGNSVFPPPPGSPIGASAIDRFSSCGMDPVE